MCTVDDVFNNYRDSGDSGNSRSKAGSSGKGARLDKSLFSN